MVGRSPRLSFRVEGSGRIVICCEGNGVLAVGCGGRSACAMEALSGRCCCGSYRSSSISIRASFLARALGRASGLHGCFERTGVLIRGRGVKLRFNIRRGVTLNGHDFSGHFLIISVR